ncbi:hypothetical protein [Methylobacterium haplocladii]|uniref:Ribosomal protein S27 n=1 Tax=Methylobacterium haplocladii TaxID=1176176 RepID=A0A512IS46_9HYPH|nr:hypothetical protein [Methylobacterium haplocladii]GEP00527.1 hypothetical protein MHA02_29140 [Methylobacterium haplocladii]GJD85442.1 hypothetical protein HPGCJGGD_3331 [Methylobacterium haplocladii]GLS57827.1 hypothetical protein GCM10007887_04830 [Methylobacterium haplocladii]
MLAVILVCMFSTAPADCTRATALDVVTRPVAMPTECGMAGQVVAADSLGVDRAERRYIKIVCEKRHG